MHLSLSTPFLYSPQRSSPGHTLKENALAAPLSVSWPFRTDTEKKRTTVHSPIPNLKGVNTQGKESCLKKEVLAEVGWRMAVAQTVKF